MPGGVTANNHVIKTTDIFVALPSAKSLCSSDTNNTCTVNLSCNGYSLTNVPVWDIGPYNEKDDYWNITGVRDTWGYGGYGNCSRGSSEAFSAYISNFHNGWTSSHRTSQGLLAYVDDTNVGSQVHTVKKNPYTTLNLTTPAEIDFSDGVWNALHMTNNGYVTVTFNWVAN